MEREPMLDMFLFETNQLIEQLEEIIIEFERNKIPDSEAINEIFRIMHTIKGSSAMMMLDNISSLAHSIEDLFSFIRDDKSQIADYEKLSNLVLPSIDFIKNEIDKLENSNEADGNSTSLVESIQAYLTFMKSPSPKFRESKYYMHILFEEDCQMESIRAFAVFNSLQDIASEINVIPEDILDRPDGSEIIQKDGFSLNFSTNKTLPEIREFMNQPFLIRSISITPIEIEDADENIMLGEDSSCKIEEKDPSDASKDNNHASKMPKQQNIISVNVLKLDMLMDLVGEIVISEAMVTRNPEVEALDLESFSKAARQLRKLTDELQDIVMSIRMVPVSMTFHKMNRIVHDMSKKLNKDVELEIIGEETEVDKNIIDHLSDPLMHLIRNAVDHGLESKEDRIKLGKPEQGKVTLEAKSAGGDVWIIIKDDGQGLHKEKILAKAKQNGLLTKNENELTDKEIFSFILLPGFSTNDTVTEFSGRGVGMDVVKKNIDSIGGSISIESTPSQGTTIFIKIPLTLAIIDGMKIRVGKTIYTLPITSIHESFKPSSKDVIEDCNGNEMIMIRGQCYPVLRIHKTFNIHTETTKINDGIMVMVDGDSKSACIFADELLGEQQVVVKALPKYMKKVPGITGCTILGDGSISLIIDVNGILERI